MSTVDPKKFPKPLQVILIIVIILIKHHEKSANGCECHLATCDINNSKQGEFLHGHSETCVVQATQ